MVSLYVYLLPITCLISRIYAYPFTFSERECRDMFPESLGYDSQLGPGPFDVSVTQNMYTNKNTEIDLTIKSTDSKRFIRGFFIQARRGDCGLNATQQQKPFGYFAPVRGDVTTQTVDCFGVESSAIANKKWHPRREIVVRFFVPGIDIGPFYFRATIVDSKDVFWTRVFSEGIRHTGSTNTGMRCPTRLHLKANGSNTLKFSFLVVFLGLFVTIYHMNESI